MATPCFFVSKRQIIIDININQFGFKKKKKSKYN